jgi:hypothetical protein
MTIGSDARASAAARDAVANSGFVTQSGVNLGLQGSERQAFAQYLESIKPAIRNAVVDAGHYDGSFELRHALKNTSGKPPKQARYLIDETGHPYHDVWAAFVAWAGSEELVGPTLFKETLYLLPPPNENYNFRLTFKP